MVKKKKEVVEIDRNFDYMKTVKDNLDNVLADQNLKPQINGIVNRVNKIVIHTYQYIKLYCLHLLENNKPLPEITKDFISDVFKVITIRTDNRGNSTKNAEHMKKLKDFYSEFYSNTITNSEELIYDKLSYILPYEAIDMVTNINVNIQEHFVDHLNKYINIVFDVKAKQAELTKSIKDVEKRKLLKNQLYKEIEKIKTDLKTFGEFTSDPKYHNWIKTQRGILFPGINNFTKDNINYDIKVNPQNYLVSMFYLNNEFERINNENRELNKSLPEDKQIKEIRLFNVLPLRTNIIGKHICFDTSGLIMTFFDDTSYHLKNYKKDNMQDDIWGEIFNINKSTFRKKLYRFDYMIRTDGVSCCILLIRKDINGKPVSKGFADCKMDTNTDYIENIDINILEDKKIVCADPGKSDLIYCGSFNKDNELETFRYTQSQRNVETKSKKYNKIIDNINKETIISDKTIKELETDLSDFNSKTCNYTEFKKYLVAKNQLNYKLYSHYEQRFFRKFKLNRYTNTQKSESKMIKNFRNKFGSADNTVFVIGDYDKGSYNMRGCEPAICKKFRKIFKNAGYQTLLINEFRTSKISNCCKTELEKFHYKPHKNGKNYLCHGLLRCKSVKHNCETIHNRDKNAVINMLNIVSHLFTTGTRPAIFTRTEIL
jgi:hypothetical protein